MVALTTFEAPLLRLILCGGGGLGPFVGAPLAEGREALGPIRDWLFDLRSGHALSVDDDADGGALKSFLPVLESVGRWSIPLDPASPWPARLALVAALLAAAWMPSGASAEVVLGECWLHLYTYSGGVADVRAWACNDGGNIEPGAVRLDLPTLPVHLAAHPPVVALLLALFDVPEIRARVESTCR